MVNKNLRQIVNEQILNDLLLEAKVPSNTSFEDKKRIHSYLRDDMDIKYKMMQSDDPSMLKLDVTPVSVYSVRECIKDKFNNMLKRING